MSSERSLTLGEVLSVAAENAARELRVAMPGRVESYDAATQRANVLPLLRNTHLDEAGAEVSEPLSVVNDVPVCFPGAGDFYLTFPVQRGDLVLLVFADRSLDVWKGNGGEVDPIDVRHHHLSDAMAIPGLRSLNRQRAAASPDAGYLGHNNGLGVYFHEGSIGLGEANPGDAVAMAAKVESELNKLWDVVRPLTTAPGPPPPPIPGTTTASGVGSSTVKVKG